ncbi:MAG TPA: 1-deoxy-D-xylulose-5-phosphate reductoisomerase [Candidatus Omnitrophota bacterium]|nr:1-deoxy-D-xylulose-5-phosphate reductoisomerase [Candidatus Omnitrophota bacterium]HQB94552.1 1-deoxy-D-xylulose-5-phosphate reductoisomerase [Candidatus Omnitrophota bacterium]
MKRLAILGSTGSVGENALRIVRIHPDRFRVDALAVKKSVARLYEQAVEFRPKIVCIYDGVPAGAWLSRFKKLGVRVVTGDKGLEEVATFPSVRQVVCAMVGAAGLKPIFAAVRARKMLAVANKEPLVMAGKLLLEEAAKHGVAVLPVDSEHSALWQCLEGRDPCSVKKLILTSSGGPFRNVKGSLARITPAQALAHPKWKMGPKITVDSATMMNKGLEAIEAANLFHVEAKKIEVVIHPEAIVHALVEFVDGSHMAHLGVTDMRIPIQYAMSYPGRLENHLPHLDLARLRTLHFEKPDMKRFPCLALGYEASRIGGTMPAVLNAANEVAVEAFLGGKAGFMDIPKVIERTMMRHSLVLKPGLEEILDADLRARQTASELL